MKNSMADWQEKHPELKPGEIWLFNGTKEEAARLTYRSLRIGKDAYDIDWKILPNLFPLFVSKQEYEER